MVVGFLNLPSQDYFFAEGKGEYYAQAEYAEYRFKRRYFVASSFIG